MEGDPDRVELVLQDSVTEVVPEVEDVSEGVGVVVSEGVAERVFVLEVDEEG